MTPPECEMSTSRVRLHASENESSSISNELSELEAWAGELGYVRRANSFARAGCTPQCLDVEI